MKSLIFLTLAYITRSVEAANTNAWNYKTNGADWPSLNLGAGTKNLCGTENQSPIDLSYTKFDKIKTDEYMKNYQNVQNAKVAYKGPYATIQVDTTKSYFTSKYAKETLGANNKFQSVQFHFHAESEHTIDGQRFDLEMHTVHYPPKVETGFIAAALGIIFDTKNYDKSVTPEQVDIIDRFFDSMDWNKFVQTPFANTDKNPVVAEVNYGELINNLNTSYRFVYSGSVTTPPCAKSVYWNVIATVMPIKERHYKLFQDIITKKSPNYVTPTGNYRVICKLDKQNPKLMVPNLQSSAQQTKKPVVQQNNGNSQKQAQPQQNNQAQSQQAAAQKPSDSSVTVTLTTPSSSGDSTATTIIAVVLGVLVVIAIAFIIYLQAQNSKTQATVEMMGDMQKLKGREDTQRKADASFE